MNVKEACKLRKIRNLDIKTPLLVPSFSSEVNRTTQMDIRQIHQNLRIDGFLSSTSLVSAYDMYYKFIDIMNIWCSDIVFIDSGNYEHKWSPNPNTETIWSLAMYHEVLKSLPPPTSGVVLINYDERLRIKEQISSAKKIFDIYPTYTKDFLCKPIDEKNSNIDVTGLIKNTSSLSQFDILGLTEKELGDSPIMRCTNLLRIRHALDSDGISLPIHIFGCLDPLNIIIYFLCGADIFDGLVWLKYSFYENMAIYIKNYALLSKSWSMSNSQFRVYSYVLNLKALSHLTYLMQSYALTHKLESLELSDIAMNEVKRLTALAGLSI